MAANTVKIYPVGVQGAQGEAGTSGTSGASGSSGTSGVNGSSGTSGTSPSLIPSQTSVTAVGTDITTTEVLSYSEVHLISATLTNYAVRLPQPQLGGNVYVVNQSSVNIYVFPYDSNDAINGLNAGEHYMVPPDDNMYAFTCIQNPSVGNWSVAAPTQNNTITKTVNVNLTADGTYFDSYESWATQTLLNGTVTTFYPGGVAYKQLNAPSSTSDWFDTAEFNNYTSVRIIELTVKSNVLAGDLTSSPTQISSTLMGINSSQLYNLFGFVRMALMEKDGSVVYTTNEYNGARFLDFYSPSVASGISTGDVSHYANSTGTLYQQIKVATPNSNWIDINDNNGNRRIYYGPYIGYGSSSSPYSGYPPGFEFTAEIIVKFEFK